MNGTWLSDNCLYDPDHISLKLCLLGTKKSGRDILKYFSYFTLKIQFDISCEICTKYQLLSSKKTIINLQSAALAESVKG